MISRDESLQTPRLQLLPCSLGIARAAVAGSEALRHLLKVNVADGWPEEDVREFFPMYAALLEEDPSLFGWGIWVIVHAEERTIIGDVGYKGQPDHEGVVEIGYSVVPAYRRRGYASEATRALVSWGLRQPGVTRVCAECYRDNQASIGVLRKVGLAIVAEEDGILRWATPSAGPNGPGEIWGEPS